MDVKWRKSERSDANGGNCVELACIHRDRAAVRDSKNPKGGALIFGRHEWAAFLEGVKSGAYDI